MAVSTPLADLERRDLHQIVWRFHISSKENGVRKLL